MSKPWNLESRLTFYLNHLENVLFKEVPEAAKLELQRRFSGKNAGEATAGDGTESVAVLKDGILEKNFGVPLVICVTKSDFIGKHTKTLNLKDNHFEFIASRLRLIALKYGAALFYTSAVRGDNCQHLKSYLEYLLIGDQKFDIQPEVVEKNVILVPIGWDSSERAKLALGGEEDASKPFNDVIVAPVQETKEAEKVVTSENDQAFLLRNQKVLEALASATPDNSPLKTPAKSLAAAGSPAVSSTTPTFGTPSTPIGEETDHAVLASFFNSLIKKTPGSAPATPTSAGTPTTPTVKK